MNKQTKQDKGFTLVELLIVIVILGILATVTVFAVRGITDESRTNSCAAEEKTIQTAIEAFYADHGADAQKVSDLVPSYLKQDPFTDQTNSVANGSGHFAITFNTGAAPTMASGSCTFV